MRILGWILRAIAGVSVLLALLLAFGGDWGPVAGLGIGGVAIWGAASSLINRGKVKPGSGANSSDYDFTPLDYNSSDYTPDASDTGGIDF